MARAMVRPSKSNENGPRLVDGHFRVVLSPAVRKVLGVDEGDYVTFEIKGREVRLVKVRWVPE